MTENDGRFPDGSSIRVRFPQNQTQETGPRELWPWLPGTVLEQCGPNEWLILVEHPDLAEPDETGEPTYPTCYRDAEEIRRET